ncbi:MAG: DUF2214 family protein [Cyanobacteria bacterium RI_101]|nr:DUF2214 family protein [Cyanobacteria bacterium RI_101]
MEPTPQLWSAVTAYLHYLSFMVSYLALGVEYFHLAPDISLKSAKRVAFADIAYGIAATLVLVTGVLRVIYFGKGTDYYLHNPFFHIKVGLFVIVGLLSLYPTFTFIFWFKDFQKDQAPTVEASKIQRLSTLVKFELAGFTLLPLFAALMARANSLGQIF